MRLIPSVQFQGQLALICSNGADNILTLCKHFKTCGSSVTGRTGREAVTSPESLPTSRPWAPGASGLTSTERGPLILMKPQPGFSAAILRGTDLDGNTMSSGGGLEPGSSLRRSLALSDSVLLLGLPAKPSCTAPPSILEIYPSRKQTPPQFCASLSDSRSSHGEKFSLKPPFPQTFRNLKVGCPDD